MTGFLVFVLLRSAAIVFVLFTSAYGVATYSPFAFDMFIRPQLVPAVAQFVAWHHVWYFAAFIATVLTILPELRSNGRARWPAILYVVVFAALGVWLLLSPYLPRLWNDRRSLVVAAVAFLPLLWLAAIDHLSAWKSPEGPPPGIERPASSAQRRLLAAAVASAIYLWGVHLIGAVIQAPAAGVLPWILSAIWALTLVLGLFVILYSAFCVIEVVSDCAPARHDAVKHVMTTALVAAVIGEVCRRVVFPTISLGAVESAAISAITGVTLAAAWSGMALRRPARNGGALVSGIEMLLVPVCRRSIALGLLIVVPVATFAALGALQRLDWDFVLQRLAIVAEFAVVFGLFLSVGDSVPRAAWSQRLVVVPAVTALALLFGVPRATSAFAGMIGDRSLEPAVVLDRHAAGETAIKLIANSLISRPGFDPDYFRYLQLNADISNSNSFVVPAVETSEPDPRAIPPAPSPDVYLFVVDSLRRDYVGTYNPKATFTPNIDRFANEGFVFQNAFTRYGGTELAAPAIWVGGPVVRKVLQSFERINAIEKLAHRRGYELAVSDNIVEEHLSAAPPPVPLEPRVRTVDRDLCRVMQNIQTRLDAAGANRRPMFAFARPLNIHILNTRIQPSLDGDYPGFYAPYASRLKRVDGCFGEFVDYLKRTNRYDNSIIVLTGDHGDSLGEDGNWGHAFGLFPEDVRIPLVMHVPGSLSDRLTTDLGQIAFSTDIVPTIAALLGERSRPPNALFGEPLFVPSDQTLPDRRREPYLLVSSYGPTYGVLRRNGRYLYVSDLVEWREFLFDLTQQPDGSRSIVDDDVRRLNQRLIREGVADVAAFYNVRP